MKVGGNVAAYFCTPDLEVIHAVAGPVPAETFLREAKFALDLSRRIGNRCYDEKRILVREALESHPNVGLVSWNQAVWSGAGPVLAKNPMAVIEDVSRSVFEGILGEKLSDADVVKTSGFLQRYGNTLNRMNVQPTLNLNRASRR